MAHIAKVVGAEWNGKPEETISAVCTDSRAIQPGCLFIALQGERFNGHRYIHTALENGAAYAIASEPGDYPVGRVLMAEDTRHALLAIANLYRKAMDVKIVGVTGSVGKTTTKEMVACALSARYATLKNEANLNNEIGLSQTILQLEPVHRAAVLEMGMDAPGQIRPLALCAQPDVGIVTNIGVSHMEALGSREKIRDEKLSITAGMPDGAPLILCGDNDLLRTYSSKRLRTLFYGIDNTACVVRAKQIQSFATHTTFQLVFDGTCYDTTIPTMGRHHVYNALAAFSAAICLDVPPQDAIAALGAYRPAGMRQNIVKHSAFTVVEDCYNASPDSMRAALTTLAALECDGKRIAVLADMMELGSAEREAHLQTGRLAAQCADVLLCTGPIAQEYVRGAQEANMEQAYWFANQEELFAQLKDVLQPGDTVWVKASRGMHLEWTIKRIYEEL